LRWERRPQFDNAEGFVVKLKLLAAVAATLAICAIVSPAHSATVGFIYSSGSYKTLSVPGAYYTEAFGINNAGQVVGDYQTNSGSPHVGFLYGGGIYTTFNVPGASLTIPWSINNAGQIAGYYASAGNTYGFIYSGGSFTTLSVNPSPSLTWGYGINDAGQVVGSYGNFPSDFHGYLYSGGGYGTFSYPCAASTAGFGINNGGQIVGISTGGQSFLYSAGGFVPLSDPAASTTYTYGINNSGDIVGETDLGPFLYTGGVYDIFANGTNVEAFGINDADQVVGRLDDYNSPATPLPAALPLFATGLGVIGLFGWRRRRKAADTLTAT
jgi:probable HAF family extracellular repeat protein